MLPVGPHRAGGHGSLIWLVVFLVALSTRVGAQSDFDFGDAPDSSVGPMWSYPTLLIDDGARHLVPSSPTHFLDGGPTPFTERVSMDSSGVQGNHHSYVPSISADGRFVAFKSRATNLVPGDTNGYQDVFVRDRDTGTTTRVSVDSSGVQGNHRSASLSISADGRYVAFSSEATNLVPGDTNGKEDVFVRDRDTGTTTRVSVDSSGVQGDGNSFAPSISADGRFVAFASGATNLVPGDTNGLRDVFVHDRDTGTNTLVSVDSSGVQGNIQSWVPSISADGRYVAFSSEATNLVPGDTNGYFDVFVHDRDTGTTTRVSVDSSGVQGDGGSGVGGLSADGRYVAFGSAATNLVPGDTNGEVDVFVHDRDTGTTTRVSVDSSGVQGDDGSWSESLSADGRYVAFDSAATTLVPGDTNGNSDVFVHDRDSDSTTRVGMSSFGHQGNEGSWAPAISADGHFVAFQSNATNLVPGDTNGRTDGFVCGEYDPLDAETDGAPSQLAIGDDHDSNDDEQGVLFPCCMEPGGTARVQIDVSAAGFVNAWIDFDGDGDWGDSGEQILTDHAVAAGWNEISYAVPSGAEIPLTYARVRFTSYDTAGTLGVTGQANDGEVEDYWVEGTPLFGDGFELGDTSTWSATVP